MTPFQRGRARFSEFVRSAPALLASPNIIRAGIYVTSALASALIPFLLLPILARALGPSGYGLVGAFTGLVSIVSVFVGLSTHGILTTIYFRVTPEQYSRYLAACLWIAAVTTPTLWLLALWFEPVLVKYTGIPASWYWALMGAAAGQFFLSVSLAICQVRGQALRFAGLQISNTALNLLLTIWIVVGLSWGWEGRAVAQCVATLGVGLTGLILVRDSTGNLFSTNRESVTSALKFGAPLVPHLLAATVMVTADRLILLSTDGPMAAGHYFAAFQVAGVIWMTSSAINQAMVPWLFRTLAGDQEKAGNRVVRITYLVILGLALQGLAIAVLAEPLMLIIGGAAYVEAAPVVRILALAMTIKSTYFLFTNYIFYGHKTHLLSIVTLSASVVQVFLTLAFAAWFGIEGAAWAAVLGSIIYIACVWRLASRVVPMPWFSAWGRSS